MRKLFFILLLVLNARLWAQDGAESIPPALQWQRCYGGTEGDVSSRTAATEDGNLIIIGTTRSSDGDMGPVYGLDDVFLMKIDLAGNILWRKNYGGSQADTGSSIIVTTDGGYIFTAKTRSNDGDVSGMHGVADLWVVKLDNNGAIQWQRCYGGPGRDEGGAIKQTPDGGYIIVSSIGASGGDISGWNGYQDAWVVKINATGVIQWEKALGGTNTEFGTDIELTSDGGYIVAASANSNNGDVTCAIALQKFWLVKLNSAGVIQWNKCILGGVSGWLRDILRTTDGGFIITGVGNHSYGGDVNGFVLKCNATGDEEWRKELGGTGSDDMYEIAQTADGGYIISGITGSTDGDICINKGLWDIFLVKLYSDGTIDWRKTYGGSQSDFAKTILQMPDGSYYLTGYTVSNDGDISGNHSNDVDVLLIKLDYPGVAVLPTIQVQSDRADICAGQTVTFTAAITMGGTDPQFQWQLNGANIGTSNDTIVLNNLQHGDIVHCIITSNSPCVTSRNAVSNDITISVDPSLNPSGFLPNDITMCKLEVAELRPTGNYETYLWSTGATTPTLKVRDAGKYWVDVKTNTGCPGSDTINISLKECLIGVFIPTGFTPNNDGKNDLLIPFVGGKLVNYQLTIFNRGGEIVFKSTDPLQGWDGRLKGIDQNSATFVWTCTYQLVGQPVRSEKGVLTLIR